MRRGLLIVFEGLDRSGKSTHSRLLSEYLRKKYTDDSAVLINFPNRTTETGKKIDLYLRKELELDDKEIHKLFSDNRHECISTMREMLLQGKSIVLDRYSYSGAVFSASKGLDLKWCFQCEAGLIVPDLVFFMDLTPSQLAQRSDFGLERYETVEFQTKAYEKFLQLEALLQQQNTTYKAKGEEDLASKPWRFVKCLTQVDGQEVSRTIDDVQNEVRDVVDKLFEEPRHELQYFETLN